MGRFIMALLAFGMALAVLKMVLVALLFAGLIFRTKETVGLIILLGLFALLRNYPVACIAVLGAAGVFLFVRWIAKADDAQPEVEPAKLTDDSTT